jgi:large subunit ribosomal protein L17
MLSNLAVSVLDKERVETTLPKAKEVRGVVERLITYAKQGDLHSRRQAARRVNDKTVLSKLFSVIGPHFKDRNGGYVRIIKTNERKGDNTLMAIVELVGLGGADTVRKRRKQRKAKEGPAGAPVKEKTEQAEPAASEPAKAAKPEKPAKTPKVPKAPKAPKVPKATKAPEAE